MSESTKQDQEYNYSNGKHSDIGKARVKIDADHGNNSISGSTAQINLIDDDYVRVSIDLQLSRNYVFRCGMLSDTFKGENAMFAWQLKVALF